MKPLQYAFIGAALLIAPLFVQANEKVMLVLDVSGSMWGQINGVAKIEIARDALKFLIENWNDDREVGLVAYGHRKKGDCSDIEEVVPVGPLDATSMNATVAALSPKGKTPLSASVKMAAEALKYTEDKSTVILISDGKETCDLDPCKIGTELEQLGVDLTVHVIGFDIKKIEDQAQLRCLAENTGGQFISADNASELSQALAVTVSEPEPEPLPEAALNAPNKVIKGTEFEIMPEAAPGIGGYVYLYRSGKDKHITYVHVLEDADGYKPLKMRMPAVAADYELRWIMKDKRTIAIRPIVATESEVKIVVAERAIVATEIEINFDAPLGLGGYVHLYPAGRDKSIAYAYVVEDKSDQYKPSFIRLPATAGDYVLKWVSPDKQIYAEAGFVAEQAEISITAPTNAPAGTEFEVSLDAPRGLSGYIYLFPAGKKKHIAYAYVREGKTTNYEKARLRLPAEPGAFDVRWISAGKEELAHTSLTAVAAEIALNAPDSAQAGTEIVVNMVGPAGLGGYIYLYREGKDKHIAYAYVREGKVQDYAPSRIRLPTKSGNYALKWVSPKKELLAERALLIEDAQVSLDAPQSAAIGTEIDVAINAPDGMKGTIKLFALGKKKHIAYSYVRPNNTGGYQVAKLRMPVKPGDYVLRWLSNRNEVVTESPISVVTANIKLLAPAEAIIATEIEINFEAPAGLGGQVQLYVPGKKKYITYAYVREGRIADYASASLRLPGTPGDYVLRWMSPNNAQLTELPITVQGAELSLQAPEQVPVGETFDVIVKAPAGLTGNVHLETPSGKSLTYKRVQEVALENYGPISFKAPATAGEYQLKWMTRGKEVLAERSIVVVSE